MAINYVKAGRTALKLLTENGRQVQLVKLSTTPTNPNMPWYGSDEVVTITATAAFIDPVSEKDLGSLEMLDPVGVDQTSVKSGEQIAFIAATENLDANGDPVDLTTFNRLIDHGLVYRMVQIHTLSPGGSPLMYQVRLAR
jgi:hypothetical protein